MTTTVPAASKSETHTVRARWSIRSSRVWPASRSRRLEAKPYSTSAGVFKAATLKRRAMRDERGHPDHGGLVLIGKAVDLKSTGVQAPWGFESLALRHFLLTG